MTTIKKTFYLSALILSAGMSASTAALSADNCKLRFTSAQLDQDLFVESVPFSRNLNEDRDYTIGMLFSFQSCADSRNPLLNFSLQKKLLEWVHSSEENTHHYITSFGSSTFTPDDLDTTAPVMSDKPYSSILYMANSMISASPSGNSASEVDLSVSVLGLPFSKWMQTGIHTATRAISGKDSPSDPMGWHNQISNGGEPSAMIKASWYDRVSLKPKWLDLAYTASASAGYYTGASAGFIAKIGKVDKEMPVWQMAKWGGTHNSTHKGAYSSSLVREKYLIIANRLTLVGYNALLQGQFRRSSHELSAGQVKRFVIENTVGFGFKSGINNINDWQFSCTRRSADHKLTQARNHYWCGFGFTKTL